MEEINWNVVGNNEIRRKFVIPVGSNKKWWQFWKKDKYKEAQKSINKFLSEKCNEDFFIPVKPEQAEN
ncbi:MAG: hypothetical protein WC466_06860 [Candidatus Izemoplasmatales bacterium]